MSVSSRRRELLTELGHAPDYEPDPGTEETEFLYEVYSHVKDLERDSVLLARKIQTRYEAIFARRKRECQAAEASESPPATDPPP